MQPAFSSNPSGIETKFRLSDDIPLPIRLELISIIGETIPDHRFWIPRQFSPTLDQGDELTRLPNTSSTHVLCTTGKSVSRLETLKRCLSLGFVLNDMHILELILLADVKVTLACESEPYNFHSRLLRDNNKIDSVAVTFTYRDGALDTSVELMIISVICRSCGLSRM